MRFRDVYKTRTFEKFDGKIIKIEGKSYDIDILPFDPADKTTRMWIRARRVYDCKLYGTENLCGFSNDNKKVMKTLYEIKRRIFEDLIDLGLVNSIEEFYPIPNIFSKDIIDYY